MSDFNLEKAIQDWKQKLGKHQQLEPGDIAELENHLYESVDTLLEEGMGEKAAFQKATKKIEKGFEETLEDYRFTSATHEPKSKWFASWWIPPLLPNVLKMIFRNFKRQPGYSFINVSGLAIGMACCIIIFLFVQDELSYDSFHEHSDRIYRVDQSNIWNDFEGLFGSTGPGVASTLIAEFPEIETTVRVNNMPDMLIAVQHSESDTRYFEEPRVLATDSSFFDVFNMDFVEGTASQSLVNPYSIVITEETKTRYFRNESALGKTITMGDPGQQKDFQVTGVVKKFPENSHFTFDLLTTLSSNPNVKRRESTWIWTVFVTYLVLNEEADPIAFQEKLSTRSKAYAQANVFPYFGDTSEEEKNYSLVLTPITDIHLNINQSGNRIGTTNEKIYIYIFSSIAIMIILLAGINFMNLASARSVHRSKEVGIRKTLGSERFILIGQFLSESLLFSVMAMIIALFVVFLSLPYFNSISAKVLIFSDLLTLPNVATIVGLTIATGLLAGLYPAFYLTSFNPVEALKGKTSSYTNSRLSFSGLRNFLVIFQFAVSIMLISCSFIIYQQLHYLQNKNLGFDKENLLVIENVEKLGDQIETFKQVIEQNANVISVSQTNGVPPNIWYEDFSTVYGSDGTNIPMNTLNVDSDFTETMVLQILKGRNFEQEYSANQRYVLINEQAIESLNWSEGSTEQPDFPIGESITFSGNDDYPYEVIGVVNDFNTNSLYYEIQPLAIFHHESATWKGQYRFLVVRTGTQTNLSHLVSSIENDWIELSDGLPFDFAFLNDQLDSQYRVEQQVASVVILFTGLAIFIAILGLLGLISFAIERRTKEIGVRKVMGASSPRIVFLLSRDTLKLVLISILISVPVSWYLMKQWLQNFEYPVGLNPAVFMFSGFLALLLAWIAVSYQTIKASVQNPVKSLRSE